MRRDTRDVDGIAFGRSSLTEAFEKHVRVRRTKAGWSMRCKRGLWAVSAPTFVRAYTEAMHYFAQYHADGEYDG